MLIEKIQLSMSQLGLGNLNEVALMILFGDVHSRRLVKGLPITPNDIVDSNDNVLYPAYFVTKLRVPRHKLLKQFVLWSYVDVAVNVERFGNTILQSQYIIGPADSTQTELEDWNHNDLPTMFGNNLIVVDTVEGGGTSERIAAAPLPEKISDIPKMRLTPSGLLDSKSVRVEGFGANHMQGNFVTDTPINYTVIPGRDAASGHAMIFAKFAEIMDFAEFTFLSQQLKPSLPLSILQSLEIVERDIYYYGNCFAGEELEIYISCSMETLDKDENFNEERNTMVIAEFELQFEIYKKVSKELLSIASARKILDIPVKSQLAIQDFERIVNLY